MSDRDDISSSGSVRPVQVIRYSGGEAQEVCDQVAVEEPFEIRLGYRWRGRPMQKSVSVTMRTRGHDRELAVGFLFGEGIISSRGDVAGFADSHTDDAVEDENTLRVELAEHVEVDIGGLQRHFYTTSSCGVCGKASLEALRMDECRPIEQGDAVFDADFVHQLPERLRSAQEIFESTGGLHAAGLFDPSGELVTVREDVGRHNAMDKLVGRQLLDGGLPLQRRAVVLSGRASFELLQKALRAQAPLVVAVGAPSSLAVSLAERFGVTLVGFARGGRFNVYANAQRIR